MKSVDSVLIVGAGTAGPALATFLGRKGVSVEIAEIRPDGPGTGSGITLQGNALRVLSELGVWDEVSGYGFAFDTLGFRLPDGTLAAEVEDARSGGADLPATVGMERPRLAAILIAAARRAGAKIHFDTTVTSFEQDPEGVTVAFSDGREGRYDLVVGTDGIRSQIRRMVGIGLDPTPTGLAIWRVTTQRPAEIVRTDLVYGGSCHIAGYCPTGPDSIYAYLVEDARPRASFEEEDKPALMRSLALGYHGSWDEIRDQIDVPDHINYALFESLLIEGPWHRGRVVLIGDAAHACPPTLAQGAAMCLEDASVLAELLLAHRTLDDDLWAAFAARRVERVRTVVEGSLQIARWQLEHSPEADVPGLMIRVFAMLTEPA